MRDRQTRRTPKLAGLAYSQALHSTMRDARMSFNILSIFLCVSLGRSESQTHPSTLIGHRNSKTGRKYEGKLLLSTQIQGMYVSKITVSEEFYSPPWTQVTSNHYTRLVVLPQGRLDAPRPPGDPDLLMRFVLTRSLDTTSIDTAPIFCGLQRVADRDREPYPLDAGS